jgi:tetratricopeptide (TPR) repeat protein
MHSSSRKHERVVRYCPAYFCKVLTQAHQPYCKNPSCPAGAKETFALALSTAGSKSWAQRAIAKTQAEAGDFAGSQVTFGHALETAGLIQKADDQVSEQQAIAQARAEAGDFAGALNTADLLHEAYLRSKAQAAIAEIQAAAGDRAGAKTTFATALKTADSVKSDENKNSDAHATIAEALARTGDLAGALMIADLVQAADLKYSAQQTVAEAQAAAGDVAGAKATFASALVTANRIERDINRAGAQMDIAKAQVKTGDLAGAQMTADSIQDVTYQGMAQSAIDDAAATTGAAIPRTAASRPRIVVQTPVQPAIPPIKVSSWLDKLDDKTDSADCPLNTEPFLDLAGFLKSLPPSDDPQKVFESLSSLAKKIVKAQNTIGGMLQRQAKQAAKS